MQDLFWKLFDISPPLSNYKMSFSWNYASEVCNICQANLYCRVTD